MVDPDSPLPSDLHRTAPILNDVERGDLRSLSQITIVESGDIVPETKTGGPEEELKLPASDGIVLAVDERDTSRVVRVQGRGLTDGDQGACTLLTINRFELTASGQK